MLTSWCQRPLRRRVCLLALMSCDDQATTGLPPRKEGHHVSLARLPRFPHLAREGPVLTGALADRAEPAFHAWRGGHQRRRVRDRLVRRPAPARRVPEHRASLE